MTGHSLHRVSVSQQFTLYSLWRDLSAFEYPIIDAAPSARILQNILRAWNERIVNCERGENLNTLITSHIVDPHLWSVLVLWVRYDGQRASSLYKREKLIISRKQPRLSWADSLAFWRNNSFFTAADWIKVQSDVWSGQGNTLRRFLMSLLLKWWPGSGLQKENGLTGPRVWLRLTK